MVENNANVDGEPVNDSSSEEEVPLIEVKAPTSLLGGYKFWASFRGRKFQVTVPEDGVAEGESLRIAIPVDDGQDFKPSKCKGTSANPKKSKFRRCINYFERSESDDEESGHWDDEVLDLFKQGRWHPTPWKSMFCPEVLMAQILARMGLTWALQPPPGMQRTLLLTFLIFFTLDHYTSPYTLWEFDSSTLFGITFGDSPWWRYVLYGFPGIVISAYTFKVSVDLRRYVRQQYNIKTGKLGCCEDFCCMLVMHPCSLSQLARKTVNYNQIEGKAQDGEPNTESLASCCSKDGLSSSNERVDFCLLMLV